MKGSPVIKYSGTCLSLSLIYMLVLTGTSADGKAIQFR